MRSKLIQEQPRTYALIFQTGDEIASMLRQFAADEGLSASSFKAIEHCLTQKSAG